MPLIVNLRHMVDRDLDLKGELSASELDIEIRDEVLQVDGPLGYDLTVQRLDESLLIRGHLRLKLNCECVRCLKSFKKTLEIEDYLGDVPLAGEDKAPVVNDCVDLTPYIREDILLALPQHPLCKPDCGGLKNIRKSEKTVPKPAATKPSVWADLDKLKL